MLRARTLSMLSAAAVLTFALVGCAESVDQAKPTPTPTVTAEAPAISGDGVLRIGTLAEPSAGGAAVVAGAELAVREINGAGGVNGAPVQLFHRNAASEAGPADLAAKLADVVVGASLTAPVAAAVEDAGMTLISIDTSASPDDAFNARLTQSDPTVSDFTGAVEAYDAVISAALAAVVAADDGAASIAFALDAVVNGDAPCGSYGECLAALDDGFTIGYQAITASAKP